MPHHLRFPLVLAVLVLLAACQTHDRRIYSTRRDKNLHTPDPWAATPASATKGAAEAVSPATAEPITPPDSANPTAPGSPPAPAAPQ